MRRQINRIVNDVHRYTGHIAGWNDFVHPSARCLLVVHRWIAAASAAAAADDDDDDF